MRILTKRPIDKAANVALQNLNFLSRKNLVFAMAFAGHFTKRYQSISPIMGPVGIALPFFTAELSASRREAALNTTKMADVEGVAAAVRAELGEGAAADEVDPAELPRRVRRRRAQGDARDVRQARHN